MNAMIGFLRQFAESGDASSLRDQSVREAIFNSMEDFRWNTDRPTYSVDTVSGLKGYTFKPRKKAFPSLMGQADFDSYLAFIDSLIVEPVADGRYLAIALELGSFKVTPWGVPIQPSELKGEPAVGMRRMLLDLICTSGDYMDLDRGVTHLDSSYHNGFLFAIRAGWRNTTDYQVGGDFIRITSPTQDGLVLPASFPPGFVDKLADWLEAKLNG